VTEVDRTCTPNGIFFELILKGHDIFLKKNTAVQYESEDE
jgi:hypothetical protein